jgi:hypothetical protein
MSSTATGNAAAGNQTYSSSTPSSYKAFKSFGNMKPTDDLMQYAIDYARQNPGTAALWCFGVGFILGWKLKPW